MLLLTAVLAIPTAVSIDGFTFAHEEIEPHLKHRPHHSPRRNEYQWPLMNEQMLILAEDEDQTAEQLSHMVLYCPICNREGYINGGRHTMIEDGYYYIINHRKNERKCIVIEQRQRDEILRQIKNAAYKKDIQDPCLRYLATICKEALEQMGVKFQSTVKKDDFYSFRPS